MRKLILKISDALDRYVAYLCAVLLGLMTVSVLAGVLFRYVFRSPIGWTEEISRYLMIWAATLAVSMGVKHNEHIGITVLMDSITNRIVKTALLVIIDLLVLGFLVVMVWFSIHMVSEARYQVTQSFRASMFLPTLSIPLAMGLAGLQIVFKIASCAYREEPEAMTAQRNIDI
ncbi:MAG: TRAP transporter small permease [Spirochaetaceae bacterium]|nr:MAG: TRAP transporter small permease [Spirochaetaceae bacterium]